MCWIHCAYCSAEPRRAARSLKPSRSWYVRRDNFSIPLFRSAVGRDRDEFALLRTPSIAWCFLHRSHAKKPCCTETTPPCAIRGNQCSSAVRARLYEVVVMCLLLDRVRDADVFVILNAEET